MVPISTDPSSVRGQFFRRWPIRGQYRYWGRTRGGTVDDQTYLEIAQIKNKSNLYMVWRYFKTWLFDSFEEWFSDQNMKRFEIKPPPRSYLRLYLPYINAAVVVPYDTAGDDIYKLLYFLATGTDLISEEEEKTGLDYFEELKRISDKMQNDVKQKIDEESRSLVIIRPFFKEIFHTI